MIEFVVGADAQVWPMVAAGTSNSEIMAAHDIRPLFDDEDSAADEPADIHEQMNEVDAAVTAKSRENAGDK